MCRKSMSADRGCAVVDPGARTDLDGLLTRVRGIEQRIRALVAHRRATDPNPDDPFRGLYLSDEAVDRLFAPPAPPFEFPAEPGPTTPSSRLDRLATTFTLSDLDVEILLIAAIPDLDTRFEKLLGYLNDDVTRRRTTISITLELLGRPAFDAPARARMMPGSPLLAGGLVQVEDGDRPILTRALRVPDRVVAHLLGDDTPAPDLADVLIDVPLLPGPADSQLVTAWDRGLTFMYLREKTPGTGAALAAGALTAAGYRVLGVDLTRHAGDSGSLVSTLAREAALIGAGIVAWPVESLAAGSPTALRRLAATATPVALIGGRTWDPQWADEIPLTITVPGLPIEVRDLMWRREISRQTGENDADIPDLQALTSQFHLGPGQVAGAVRAAARHRLLTTDGGSGPGVADLRVGARSQNAAGLERLARRIEPQVGWADIVLPPATRHQLTELTARARYRDQVLDTWRMRPGGGRGRGVTALFAGDSGTGKTMAAEVIAADLGIDLYTVNLATVVDKYVGETEKNLERIFTEAGGVTAVLLFDEADAVFGKRSEVRDAHDRYANIESAYLLQRVETFDGLAILSTNLRANIDEAFTRRLDAIIDFPAPDETARRSLWERCLAEPLPCAADLDLDFCARSFTLSGGNIRSAATTAAYLAAARGQPVGMTDLIAAVEQEYRKLGRLVLEREFGPFLQRASNGAAPRR